MVQLADKNNPLSRLDIAEKVNSSDTEESKKSFRKIGLTIATNWPYKELIKKEIIRDLIKK